MTNEQTEHPAHPTHLNKPKRRITKTKLKKLVLSGISTSELNSKYDYSSITNMTGLFRGTKLKSFPMLLTSNVTDMRSMFRDCAVLELPLFDTSNVTEMGHMFDGCFLLESVPRLDTSSCISTRCMFRDCSKLKKIHKMKTDNVQDMAGMFAFADSLEKVPAFNTKNVENFSGMFAFSELKDIPKFNTKNAKCMDAMFLGSELDHDLSLSDFGYITPNLEQAPVYFNSHYTALDTAPVHSDELSSLLSSNSNPGDINDLATEDKSQLMKELALLHSRGMTVSDLI